MLRQFQDKLRAMCRVTRRGDPHWIPVKAEVVRVPVIGEVASLRRAVYAAFVGPIWAGEDVRPVCEVGACVRPDHIVVVPCKGRQSRGLDLSPLSLAAVRPRAVDPVESPMARRVRELLTSGLGVAQVASRVGVPVKFVVAANNGAAEKVR